MPFQTAVLAAISVLSFSALQAPSAMAEEAAQVRGNELVLQISSLGAAGFGNLLFDRDDLKAMPRLTIQTTTIWTDGVQVFTGVPLAELLQRAGIRSGEIALIAANDYVATIPVGEVTATYPLVADTLNGQPMTLRDLGPLWVVYPYDAGPEFQTEVIYTRSVWQLQRIENLD
jgi:hypothetical protein